MYDWSPVTKSLNNHQHALENENKKTENWWNNNENNIEKITTIVGFRKKGGKWDIPGTPSTPVLSLWISWWRGRCGRAISDPPLRSPMASSALPSRTFHRRALPSSAPSHPSRETFAPCCLPGAVSRRRAAVQLLSAGFLTSVAPPLPSLAARRGRIVVPPEDYATARTSVCLLPIAVAFCICSQFLAKVGTFIFFEREVGTFICDWISADCSLLLLRLRSFYCKENDAVGPNLFMPATPYPSWIFAVLFDWNSVLSSE
jgi:hypothetical protein